MIEHNIDLDYLGGCRTPTRSTSPRTRRRRCSSSTARRSTCGRAEGQLDRLLEALADFDGQRGSLGRSPHGRRVPSARSRRSTRGRVRARRVDAEAQPSCPARRGGRLAREIAGLRDRVAGLADARVDGDERDARDRHARRHRHAVVELERERQVGDLGAQHGERHPAAARGAGEDEDRIVGRRLGAQRGIERDDAADHAARGRAGDAARAVPTGSARPRPFGDVAASADGAAGPRRRPARSRARALRRCSPAPARRPRCPAAAGRRSSASCASRR